MTGKFEKSKDGDCSNKQDPCSPEIIPSEEINFVCYLSIFRRQKWFFLLVALIPTLLTTMVLYFQPRHYQIRYTYNMSLNEKSFRFLEDTFYSDENLDILTAKLQSAGFSEYARKIKFASSPRDLEKLVQLEVSPPFFEPDRLSGTSNFDTLQTLQAVEGSFLLLHITAESRDLIWDLASLIRTNFEKQVPLILIADSLQGEIFKVNNLIAGILDKRYILNLQLQEKQAALVKLKESGSVVNENLSGNLVLQFDDLGTTSEYLPVAYQIQAVETRIINLEEQIHTDQKQLDYYTDLLGLYTLLYTHLSGARAADYTTEEYHAFLLTLSSDSKSKESLLDPLQAYTKQIENLMAQSIPLLGKPRIYSLPKHTVQKTFFVLTASVIAALFAAFLRDAIQKGLRSNP